MYLFIDQPIVVACALGSAALASYTDLRSRRIPNWLTGTVAIVGLAVQTDSRGWAGGIDAISGLLLCGATFLAFYVAGGMGAGDVKLIAAEGCLLGAHRSFELLLGTVIAGGALALVLAAKRRRVKQTFRNVLSLVQHHRQRGFEPHTELNLASASALRLPYALAIATGVVIAVSVHPSMGWVR